jgi:hypothetical protein
MAVKLITQLKALWQTGYRPSQTDYSYLFDSVLMQNTTGTGTAVEFIQDKIYGSIATPETGNITANYTNANPGCTIVIIHDGASEPTYPAAFQKLDSSGTYDNAAVNFISCTFLVTGTVLVSISKLA